MINENVEMLEQQQKIQYQKWRIHLIDDWTWHKKKIRELKTEQINYPTYDTK